MHVPIGLAMKRYTITPQRPGLLAFADVLEVLECEGPAVCHGEARVTRGFGRREAA
jgi:hypothetical protein